MAYTREAPPGRAEGVPFSGRGTFLQDSAFLAFKRDAKFFFSRKESIQKGYLFREKMVYKRVKGWSSGWNLPV